jgi:hypothetical protein
MRNDELCSQCGHPFNSHRLLGYGSPPIEGWMECPVEGCGCQMTWSVEPALAAQMRGSGALRRFWWPVAGHLGIGVTSYTKEEALRLAQVVAAQHGWQFEPVEVVEDVDISQLDPRHVIPNMGVCSNRGVWFPRQ